MCRASTSAAGSTPGARNVLIAAAVLVVTCAPARGLVILRQLGPCAVETDQGTVDLSTLSQGTPPRFSTMTSNAYPGVVYYDWNPCKDFNEPEGGSTKNCQSIALCAVLPQTSGRSTYLPYGNQASANFTLVSGQLILIYSSPSAGTVATVVLHCDPAARDVTACTNDENYQSIEFQYSGSSACYNKSAPSTAPILSIGTILCIAVAACLVGYFFAGLLFMKFVKKSEKTFPVPNSGFWTQLPAYVKDGFAYGVNRFKQRRPGYENV